MDSVEKAREKNREKQARYYAKNKEKVLLKAKMKREGITETPEVEIKSVRLPTPDKNENEKYFELLKSFDTQEKATEIKNLSDLQRANKIVNGENFQVLVEENRLIPLFKQSSYATLTKRKAFNIIYRLLKKDGYELTKEQNDMKLYYAYDLEQENDDEIAERNKLPIPTFSEYLKKIKEKFGEDSKIYLLSKLYEEFTLRDDFQLLIVSSTPKDTDNNYLVINKTRWRLIINKFKTSNSHSPLNEPIPTALTRLIEKYITKNNIKRGEYLFGNENQSAFVSKCNIEIGIKGGINLYRQMKITDLYNDPSFSRYDRVKLGKAMLSSYSQQKNYLRQQMEKDN